MKKPGFVYLFNFGRGYYKIGKAKEISKRKKGLQTSSPEDIIEEFIIPTDNPYQLETQLKRRFRHKKTITGGKEFFRLNKSDIQYIKNTSAERSNFCLLDSMVNPQGQRIKDITKTEGYELSQSHKFRLPSDFQTNLPKKMWREDWDLEKTFQILPYDNLWIESNQREYRWLRLLLERFLFWKLPDFSNTKFYGKNTNNFGLWIIRETDTKILFTLFLTSTKTMGLIEKFFYGFLNKNGVIALSQEQHQRFNCDESHDGYCTNIQSEKCEQKAISHLLTREQLIGDQKQKCAYEKNRAYATIVTSFKALEYLFNSEKVHIIKMKPIQEPSGKIDSRYILSNEWNIITTSNREVMHYLHGDFEILRSRKSPASHWRRAHPRKIFDRISRIIKKKIRIKETYVGAKTKIDKEKNKIYELIR